MKYKLLKWYPSLPKDWKEGMEVGQGDRGNYSDFTPCNAVLTFKSIAGNEVRNNPKYWSPYKFTTEDNIDIYKSDKCWAGHIHKGVESFTYDWWNGDSKDAKYFSTKEAAQEYIDKHQRPDFKKDDWIYFKADGWKSLVRFNSWKTSTNFTSYEAYTVFSSGSIGIHNYKTEWGIKKSDFATVTKATKEQIEEVLTKVAIDKGFVEGAKINDVFHKKPLTIKDSKRLTSYIETVDTFQFGHDGGYICVAYFKGKWSTIIKDEVPGYVELLANSFGLYKEDVAKVVGKTGDGYILYVPNRTSTSCYRPNVFYHEDLVIPSTKEKYEAQFKQRNLLLLK